jgi:hypothetical protein
MNSLIRCDEAIDMSELPAASGPEEPVASEKGSFARGLLVALPLSLVAWLVFFLLV